VGTIAAHRYVITDPTVPGASGYGWDWSYPEQIAEQDVEVVPQWLDTPALRRDLASFTGDMHRLDRALGSVLDAVARAGLADSTIVVYTVDHGIDYPCGKGTLYELGIRTALIMRVPGYRGTIEGLSSHVDLLPTLLELCGVEDRAGMDGVSFADVITGGAAAPRAEIFGEESTFPRNLIRCIRTDRFKLIHNFTAGRRSKAAQCGLTPLGGSGEHYFADRVPLELYDLERDPNELVNVVDEPTYSDVKADLQARLEAWLIETSDPILAGGPVRPDGEYERFPSGLMFDSDHFQLLWK
jgi:arylsulfatase A-like enzyme